MDVNTKHCTQIFKCVIDLLEATHNLVTARFPSVKLSISAHGAQNKGKRSGNRLQRVVRVSEGPILSVAH
jgi:hypothetical protein